ncbi:tetraspanin-18B [Tribolium castaneum]|uniref:Tetraspanin-11-like Protein n=1 Tax=Tribolium castaneum TaxID=7070 RepID=D6W8H3_TRICA|nr:PREDICTED: tetraspanin-11 [Tribolium castaneum]XP_015840680.1 PREDICTED: tetraspanin-11 [Tribolium castaneum]EEZ98301.1 Tetraspanin-11-like Protein [Tribolium castaneum]|eukprot:XP_015840679.1 PREDICTED: tetraspanin-11 [Tribolium castaneum]
MAVFSLLGSKAILAICNFLLLACGFLLITGGMLVLSDQEKILLSRLLTPGPLSNMPQPFLYYVGIGLAAVGLVLTSTGILGCWASCMNNYYLLTSYFLIIMIVLVGECAVYAIAWAWPNCLGLEVDPEDLTKSLQRNYGNVEQVQFTAAIDLAQTLFNCCGVESANEYDTSLWRLQGLGANLAIPRSCCKLENCDDSKAYLDPKPINLTLCQALEPNRHEGYRHLEGCNDGLQQWYRQHYLVFLGIGLVAVLVEFLVLLSTILMCTRIYKHNQEIKEDAKKISAEPKTGVSSVQSFQRRTPTNAYSNETYAMTNSFRQNYKLVDRV